MKKITIPTDEAFINSLRHVLTESLPGAEAHRKMASRLRLNRMMDRTIRENATKSSVLILLYPKNGQIYTVFILRQRSDGVHSGQISFPGGRSEPDDPSLIHTALREAREEVNIDPGKIQVLGSLSELYIPPSNFDVLPVVAWGREVPDFKPEVSEVAQIIQSSLDFLFDPDARKETTIDVRGYQIEAPYFDVAGHIVWGATAMILSELKEVIQRIYQQ